jgi:serine/threonine protein phosphatase 1
MISGIRNALFPAAPTRPRVDEGVRVYAVGDIHGRHDLMIAILGKIVDDFEARRDGRRCEVVFLGDYIDRGDDARQVLDSLIRLTDGGLPGLVTLRGNHEAALLDFIRDPIRHRAWLDYGARQTIADYGVAQPPRTPADEDLLDLRDALGRAMGDHLGFLGALPLHSRSGEVIFTHAGLAPGDAETLSNARAMLWGHPSSETDWPAPGRLVVHGHYDDAAPVNRPGRICVDTGAYYSGRLTAVRLDREVSFLTVTAVS